MHVLFVCTWIEKGHTFIFKDVKLTMTIETFIVIKQASN